MRYTEITLEEMGTVLKPYIRGKKGWVKARCGNEFVFDFKIPSMPIMIKVMSSIAIESKKSRNKGSDAIRVFAVRLNQYDEITGGWIKTKRVYRVMGWKTNLEKTVMCIFNQAKARYNKK